MAKKKQAAPVKKGKNRGMIGQIDGKTVIGLDSHNEAWAWAHVTARLKGHAVVTTGVQPTKED